jgi:hypothetical protein
VRHEVSSSDSSLGQAPTAELIELALRQTGELVRAEASLAKAELMEDASGAIVATLNVVVAVVFLVFAVALGSVAVSLLLGAGLPTALLSTAGVLAVFGLVAVGIGLRAAPRRFLGRSRERVAAEIRQIEDHAS